MSPETVKRAAVLFLLLAAACSSEPTDPTVGGAGGESTSGGAGAAGDGSSTSGTPARCDDGDFPGSQTDSIVVGTVTGQVIDERGEPTSAGLIQVCGKDLCINARVGDDGKVAEQVDQPMDAPALKIGDGLAWSKLAFPLEEGDSDLGTLSTSRLPDFADGVPFVPGTEVTSGGVTLELAEGAGIEVDFLTYETEAEQTFRAAPLPEGALEKLDADFVMGFGLAPVETRLCPSPGLRLENNAGLEPGTAVELYLQGFDVLEGFAPYGGWRLVGEGTVSEDGASLVFPEGPPVLTTIAVKVKSP